MVAETKPEASPKRHVLWYVLGINFIFLYIALAKLIVGDLIEGKYYSLRVLLYEFWPAIFGIGFMLFAMAFVQSAKIRGAAIPAFIFGLPIVLTSFFLTSTLVQWVVTKHSPLSLVMLFAIPIPLWVATAPANLKRNVTISMARVTFFLTLATLIITYNIVTSCPTEQQRKLMSAEGDAYHQGFLIGPRAFFRKFSDKAYPHCEWTKVLPPEKTK